MAKTDLIDVVVLVEESHREKLPEVVRGLKKKGLQVTNTLEIGVVTGQVASKSVSALRTVPGVSAVEEDRKDYTTQS